LLSNIPPEFGARAQQSNAKMCEKREREEEKRTEVGVN